MRAIVSFVCFLFLLSGCKKENNPLDQVISMRNKLQECDGCIFKSVITADYGEKVYTFSMECRMDKEGKLFFTVIEPESIAGISGYISNDSSAITFDDTVLAFQAIADDQITPITGPWVLIHTLRSGYLKGCTETDTGFQIAIDDSYKEKSLYLNIWTDKNIHPTFAEIYWQGKRVLSICVEEFAFL